MPNYNRNLTFTRKRPPMTSMISEGIQISVETFYQSDYSNAVSNEFMFAYRITIENHNHFNVKLLRRHWEIFDSCGEHKVVDGEGVIGRKPIIQKSERYQKISLCNLNKL